ncbi:MAG TPA: SLAC1 anion channel family protein [Bacillota bacterium]|nr:SLAC1 anion channel family protein [Bacillota bacterium]
MQQERGIRYFPIALFTSVMGFSGVTIAVKNMEHMYGWNSSASMILLGISSLLFLFNGGILLYRLIRHPGEVKKDFNHPVKMNFFAAISISLLLLAVAFLDIHERFSFVIWIFGALLQLSLTLAIITKLMWKSSFQINHYSPVWLIPIVGNVVAPLAGTHHVSEDVNWLFFSTGIVFSIVYLTLFINRMFFRERLPEPLTPTLFILLAPPSIGFMSYVKIVGEIDSFASVLYGIAFFIGLLLLVQFKIFLNVPFFISSWAYLFPSAAITIATSVIYAETDKVVYKWLFTVQIVGLLLLVIYLTWKTIQLMKQKSLCVKQ